MQSVIAPPFLLNGTSTTSIILCKTFVIQVKKHCRSSILCTWGIFGLIWSALCQPLCHTLPTVYIGIYERLHKASDQRDYWSAQVPLHHHSLKYQPLISWHLRSNAEKEAILLRKRWNTREDIFISCIIETWRCGDLLYLSTVWRIAFLLHGVLCCVCSAFIFVFAVSFVDINIHPWLSWKWETLVTSVIINNIVALISYFLCYY